MTIINRVFKVNGKPFFPNGTECLHASGYSVHDKSEAEAIYKALSLNHGNTMAVPAYWDQIEPNEGQFDFSSVDDIIANARKYNLRVILLWFGTWKNASMEFTPSWIKTNPQRFKRVLDCNGNDLWTLTPHCKANLEADKVAFTALCKYLKIKDSIEQTVIAVQVENEPGIIFSDRDYSDEGQTAFNSPISAQFIAAMKKWGKGALYNMWQQAGSKESGTWHEVFGWAAEAGHFMYMWHIARYIDAVAEAGKAVYEIPMFTNLWMEPRWWSPHHVHQFFIADLVEREICMDLYRWATPHLELISPDIYTRNSRQYEALCKIHTRDDNPLFMIETDGDQNMFRAISQFSTIGCIFTGIDRMVDENGVFFPDDQWVGDNMKCVASVIPLLLKYQGTGKIHAIIEEYGADSQWMDGLDGYVSGVRFGSGIPPYVPTDHRHNKKVGRHTFDPYNCARGLVIQTSKHEFYLAGAGWRIFFRRKFAPDKTRTSLNLKEFQLEEKYAHYVSVDEGFFNDNGEFVTTVRRNGAQVNHGVWVTADVGVVRVIMSE